MKIVLLNNRKYWRNGWIGNEEELLFAVNVLRDADCQVEVKEVSTGEECERLLDQVSDDVLIWTNAYVLDNQQGDIVWLSDLVEIRSLPLVGSRAETLRRVIRKDICQGFLANNGIPVPPGRVIRRSQVDSILRELGSTASAFPLVLKPTGEAGSRGVRMVRSHSELEREVQTCFNQFPESDVLLETFLPSDDVTCGFVQIGNEALLFPSYYLIEGAPGKSSILCQKARDLPWGDGLKTMQVVCEEMALNQLRRWIPEIVRVLAIRDVTRVDGRMDEEGTLRFFDVNGYPGLGFKESTGVAQIRAFYPDHNPVSVYAAYLHTVFASALLRYGLPQPTRMQDHNLFTLNGHGMIRHSLTAGSRSGD